MPINAGLVAAVVLVVPLLVGDTPTDTPIPVTHLWAVEPLLIRCPDTPVSLRQLKADIRWVRRRGGRFAGVVDGDCDGLHGPLEVWVRGPGPIAGSTVVGLTELQLYGPWALWGNVWLHPYTVTRVGAMIRRHELLHVQGLNHTDESGHLLSATLVNSGESEDGIRETLQAIWE